MYTPDIFIPKAQTAAGAVSLFRNQSNCPPRLTTMFDDLDLAGPTMYHHEDDGYYYGYQSYFDLTFEEQEEEEQEQQEEEVGVVVFPLFASTTTMPAPAPETPEAPEAPARYPGGPIILPGRKTPAQPFRESDPRPPTPSGGRPGPVAPRPNVPTPPPTP